MTDASSDADHSIPTHSFEVVSSISLSASTDDPFFKGLHYLNSVVGKGPTDVLANMKAIGDDSGIRKTLFHQCAIGCIEI